MDTTYTSPVDKLLTLGKPESTAPDSWPNYLELGLGPQHIPELISMATDPVFVASKQKKKVKKMTRLLGTTSCYPCARTTTC